MLPVSIALVNTGLAAQVSTQLLTVLEPLGALATIGGLCLVSVLVTQVIGAQVTALIIGPIAISTAIEIGIDPRAMAVAVAIATSTAFLTPIAHPVNVLMMGPGGYLPSDFTKVGIGMTLVTLVVLLLGLVTIWGISPVGKEHGFDPTPDPSSEFREGRVPRPFQAPAVVFGDLSGLRRRF